MCCSVGWWDKLLGRGVVSYSGVLSVTAGAADTGVGAIMMENEDEFSRSSAKEEGNGPIMVAFRKAVSPATWQYAACATLSTILEGGEPGDLAVSTWWNTKLHDVALHLLLQQQQHLQLSSWPLALQEQEICYKALQLHTTGTIVIIMPKVSFLFSVSSHQLAA